jgi:hypothetical protein
MTKKTPSIANVLAALPAVQKAIKRDISARLAAGEVIASSESEAYRATNAQLDTAISFRGGDRKTKRKSAA